MTEPQAIYEQAQAKEGKPRLLDLFCGAGGAAMGYHRAGFEVVGVDIKPQPHYPFEFHQADALTYPLEGFDAYHASPPCQGYSVIKINAESYERLIHIVRERLLPTSRPYVIENVSGAWKEMKNPLMLCGSMFGLRVRRHRLFECHPDILMAPASCDHTLKVVSKGRTPNPERQLAAIYGHFANQSYAREAMGIDWMTRDELAEAIPPAYTEFIGKYLMQEVTK